MFLKGVQLLLCMSSWKQRSYLQMPIKMSREIQTRVWIKQENVLQLLYVKSWLLCKKLQDRSYSQRSVR